MKKPKRVKVREQSYIRKRLFEENLKLGEPCNGSHPIWRPTGYRKLLVGVNELVRQGCVFTLKDENTLIVTKPGTSHEGRICMDDYYEYIINTVIDIVYR